MGLDNPDLINRTVVRRRAASSTGKRRWGTTTTGCSPPPFRNVRVTNAFKNKMDGSRVAGTLSLHLHFRTVSVATISRITIERDGGRDRGGGGGGGAGRGFAVALQIGFSSPYRRERAKSGLRDLDGSLTSPPLPAPFTAYARRRIARGGIYIPPGVRWPLRFSSFRRCRNKVTLRLFAVILTIQDVRNHFYRSNTETVKR